MKIILRQDVETLGRRGDVVQVADGYARNFLIPRGLAVHASKGNLRTLEDMMASIERERAHKKGEAEKVGEELSKLEIKITAKAGEKGKLYGSVTTKDLAETIKQLSDIDVDRKKIVLKEDVKTAGSHEVAIDLYPEVRPIVKFEVVPEKKEKKETKKEQKKEQQRSRAAGGEGYKEGAEEEEKEEKVEIRESKVASRQSPVEAEEKEGEGGG